MTPEQQVKAALSGHKWPVVYEKRWNDPGIAGKGTWKPRFVMMHHTAGWNSLGVLMNTRWPPVRGSHFLIDRDGTVHVLSAVKAYHAGAGGPRWGVASGQMNSYAWGIEIEDPGNARTMTAEQIDSAASLARGLLEAMGVTTDNLIQHKEWNPDGKVDTRYSTKFWVEKVEDSMGAVDGYSDYTEVKDGIRVPLKVNAGWQDIPGLRDLKGSPFRSPDEDHDFYIRLYPKFTKGGELSVECRYVRSNGDRTAFDEDQYTQQARSIPITKNHGEKGQKGIGGKWQIKLTGVGIEVECGTRYQKLRALDVRWV